MPDRRLQARLSDAELVMISFEDNGTRLQQLGSLENMSLNGAGMIVGYPIPAGSAVTITYGEGELTGIVRHCALWPKGSLSALSLPGPARRLLHISSPNC